MTYIVSPELIKALNDICDELKENRKELKQIHHELGSINSQLSGIEIKFTIAVNGDK